MLLACLHERLGIWYCILSASRLRAILLALKLLVFLYVRSFKFLFSNFLTNIEPALEFLLYSRTLSIKIFFQGWLGILSSISGSKGCCGQFFIYHIITTYNIFLDKYYHFQSPVIFRDQFISLLFLMFWRWQVMVHQDNSYVSDCCPCSWKYIIFSYIVVVHSCSSRFDWRSDFIW